MQVPASQGQVNLTRSLGLAQFHHAKFLVCIAWPGILRKILWSWICYLKVPGFEGNCLMSRRARCFSHVLKSLYPRMVFFEEWSWSLCYWKSEALEAMESGLNWARQLQPWPSANIAGILVMCCPSYDLAIRAFGLSFCVLKWVTNSP